jgi:KDO2-lipid IV(A) lauroyltransferase
MNRKFKHRLEYTVFKGLFHLTRLFPRPALLAIGRGLGSFMWKVVKFRRRVVLENLTAAFGDEHDAAWMEKTALEFWHHFGMMMMEFLSAGHRDTQDLRDTVEVANHEVLDAMAARKQGAILMAGHQGNFELMLPRAAAQGYETHGIVKAQSNKLIDGFYNGIRAREGVGIIYTGGAFQQIRQVLEGGGFIGLLGDQDAGRKGQFVPFLGRPASVSRGPATLAVKAGVPIVMAAMFRKPDHTHVLRVGPVLEADPAWDQETAITRMTEMHTAELEKAVREMPAMYYWVHRRWKTRPPEPAKETDT